MRLEQEQGSVRVVLSRRNLTALLAKLDGFPRESSCALYRWHSDCRTMLVVKAEPDDIHYANPERLSQRPGEMHPKTEAEIKRR